MTVRQSIPHRSATAYATRAEHHALLRRVEDLEDLLRLRAAEARGPTGDGLPVGQVERLLAGEHPIRVWREHRGLSVRALARMAEVDPAYLSQIENGRKPGSVAALRALAKALAVDLDDLARV